MSRQFIQSCRLVKCVLAKLNIRRWVLLEKLCCDRQEQPRTNKSQASVYIVQPKSFFIDAQ